VAPPHMPQRAALAAAIPRSRSQRTAAARAALARRPAAQPSRRHMLCSLALLTRCPQIAIIFEFTGALVLGRVSQETISGGIADIGAFTTDPEFYAYGMMWALIVGGVWQIAASYKELNVSATHSIIGAVVGFSMTFKGKGAVLWAQEQIPCTGPLTGFNNDGRPSTAMMPAFQPIGASNWVYLRGKWSVTLEDVYDPATCTVRTNATNVITTQELSKRTGLYILNKKGQNSTLFAETTSTWDQVNWMVQVPGNAPILNSFPGATDYPNPSNAPARAAYGTAMWCAAAPRRCGATRPAEHGRSAARS
jgi:hypothetical protein